MILENLRKVINLQNKEQSESDCICFLPWWDMPLSRLVFSGCLMTPGIGCLIRCDLMFYLALHFNSLKCRSLYLPRNDSPDCLGNSALPACNESGQRLEQLNRRDNQSLIQTAMQNIQAIPSENVLSGILDFKLHLINLRRGAGRVW